MKYIKIERTENKVPNLPNHIDNIINPYFKIAILSFFELKVAYYFFLFFSFFSKKLPFRKRGNLITAKGCRTNVEKKKQERIQDIMLTCRKKLVDGGQKEMRFWSNEKCSL